jgi:ribosomal protein L20
MIIQGMIEALIRMERKVLADAGIFGIFGIFG